MNRVTCTQIGAKMKQQMVSFPGKLAQHLGTSPNSQYFKVVGKAPFHVLADLPALISSQHRNAEVQAILSRLNANQLVHLATVPQQTQNRVSATAQQLLASMSRTATLSSQPPAKMAAPPEQQAQALQTAPIVPPVQQTVPQHQTQQPAGQQGGLTAAFAQQPVTAHDGAASSHTFWRSRPRASSSQPLASKLVSNCYHDQDSETANVCDASKAPFQDMRSYCYNVHVLLLQCLRGIWKQSEQLSANMNVE